MVRRRALCFVALLLLCGPSSGCATPSVAPKPGGGLDARSGSALASPAAGAPRPPTVLHYGVRVGADLRRLDVRLCFDGGVPRDLVAGYGAMAGYLRELRIIGAAGERALPVRGARVALPALGVGDCLAYVIVLRAGRGFQPAMRQVQGAAVVDTRAWLWRPARWNPDTKVTVHFDLPEGVRVALPWPVAAAACAVDDGVDASAVDDAADASAVDFAMDATALAFPALGVFGRYDVQRLRAGGAALSAVVLPGLSPATRGQLPTFIADAAAAAAGAFGRFPAGRAQVVVVPTASANAVAFGMLQRGGGASVLLLVSPSADLTTPEALWTPVHEFSHLLHPFVDKSDAWLSEGIATYYQEVLRARAGQISPEQAWLHIYRGARHCLGVDETLADETAVMAHAGNYVRVYWAGAVAALRADVALRQRAKGEVRSLDDALRALHNCCARSARAWPAARVLRRLDSFVTEPVFSPLGASARQQPLSAMADLSGLFAQLGIEVQGERVRLRSAPLSGLRDAIMAPTHRED